MLCADDDMADTMLLMMAAASTATTPNNASDPHVFSRNAHGTYYYRSAPVEWTVGVVFEGARCHIREAKQCEARTVDTHPVDMHSGVVAVVVVVVVVVGRSHEFNDVTNLNIRL